MATGRLLDGEEIVKKLMSKNGVFGVSIVDRDGESVKIPVNYFKEKNNY